ncbi:MAG: S-methyl-5'-thioinosine phosphorylase [Pseudomonadota bacterium]
MTTLAVIGGTGTNQIPGFESTGHSLPDTPFGPTSGPLLEGTLSGHRCFFLARHGTPHHLAPHRINYRANLWALHAVGAEQVIGINAVGGIEPLLVPGEVVIPDQVVDYTWGRAHTYFDGSGQGFAPEALEHVDFTEPYDREMRRQLVQLAELEGLSFSASGTLAVTQGPRLESAAEIRRLRNDGCDVVGMTGMPEAALARELGLRYASICLVVNPAAGLSDALITLESMQSALAKGADLVQRLLNAYLRAEVGPPG